MEPDDLSQEPGSADRGQDCRQFLAVMLSQPRVKARLSDEHFSVDGTLIEASASMKSFRPSRGSGASCRAKCRAKLQGRNAFDRSACVHDRSARQALSQVGWPEQPPLLHGAPADGEPQHLDCRRGTDPRQRHCGAGGGPEHDRAKQIKGGTASPSVPTWPMTCGLWSRNFKRGTSPRTSRPSATSGSAANRATAIDRRATRHLGYVISQRLRKRIEEGLWLGQDHREPRQDPSPRARPRRLVLHLHRHSLQPRQTAKAAGSRMSLSDDRQNPPIDVRKAPKQPFQRVPGPCSAP